MEGLKQSIIIDWHESSQRSRTEVSNDWRPDSSIYLLVAAQVRSRSATSLEWNCFAMFGIILTHFSDSCCTMDFSEKRISAFWATVCITIGNWSRRRCHCCRHASCSYFLPAVHTLSLTYLQTTKQPPCKAVCRLDVMPRWSRKDSMRMEKVGDCGLVARPAAAPACVRLAQPSPAVRTSFARVAYLVSHL